MGRALPSVVPAAVLAAAAFAAGCSDASAPTTPVPTAPRLITNGVPTGPAYGNVGVLFTDEDANGSVDWICTGTLVSPTVFLTAGHCTDYPATSLHYVSFQPDVLPLANAAPLIQATAAYSHPAYQFPANDIGVVILPAGATAGITPAALPPLGYLDGLLDRNGKNQHAAVNVGYGVASQGRGQQTTGLDGVRKVVQSRIQQLRAEFLVLHSNAVNAGRGGTCFGDSGGPVFLAGQNPNMTVAVTSYTITGGCQAQGGFVRLDTQAARSFLGQYVTLP